MFDSEFNRPSISSFTQNPAPYSNTVFSALALSTNPERTASVVFENSRVVESLLGRTEVAPGYCHDIYAAPACEDEEAEDDNISLEVEAAEPGPRPKKLRSE